MVSDMIMVDPDWEFFLLLFLGAIEVFLIVGLWFQSNF